MGFISFVSFNGNLLLEYLIEIPSSYSALNQIEINKNILYVLDTSGHKIHMLKIIYEWKFWTYNFLLKIILYEIKKKNELD